MTTFTSQVLIFPQPVGVREFTRRPALFKKLLAKKPLLVLNNNHPNFVALNMKDYQSLLAAAEEARWARIFEQVVAQRKNNKKISWSRAKKALLSAP